MSRLALRQKSGVVAAIAALVMGLTAAAALGWANEGNGNNDKEKEHGNKPPPTATVPPPTQTTTTPPVTQPPPATPAAPPPVTSQTTPTPPEKVGGGSTPGGNNETGGPSGKPQGPEVAETPTAAPLAPVAERKELAETGIDPGLIALLGALCLVGGALLFRRSLARG